MRDASEHRPGVFINHWDGDEWQFCTACGARNVRTEIRHGRRLGRTGEPPLKVLYRCPNRPSSFFGEFTQHTEQLVWPHDDAPPPSRAITTTTDHSTHLHTDAGICTLIARR